MRSLLAEILSKMSDFTNQHVSGKQLVNHDYKYNYLEL